MSALRFLILAALLLMVGCSDDAVTDPPGGDPGPQDSLPLVADGEAGLDRAIANLEAGYTALDYQEYERLISPDYVFVSDPASAAYVADELSASEDLDSTRNMFDGMTGMEPVLDASGKPTGTFQPVPPVQQIAMQLAPASGSGWEELMESRHGRAWRRIYDVDMQVSFAGGDRVDAVRGKAIFYMQSGTVQTSADETADVWQIRAWEDQDLAGRAGGTGAARPYETISISAIKGRY